MSTWDEDYPDGYECCASGSCEVCRGAQGDARAAAKRAGVTTNTAAGYYGDSAMPNKAGGDPVSILDGLPRYFLGDDGQMHQTTPQRSARYAPAGPWVTGASVVNALTNPPDEQLEAIALAVWDKALGVGVEEVRAVLAAAAGGDDE